MGKAEGELFLLHQKLDHGLAAAGAAGLIESILPFHASGIHPADFRQRLRPAFPVQLAQAVLPVERTFSQPVGRNQPKSLRRRLLRRAEGALQLVMQLGRTFPADQIEVFLHAHGNLPALAAAVAASAALAAELFKIIRFQPEWLITHVRPHSLDLVSNLDERIILPVLHQKN